jgi:hypothetical protein
VRPFFDTDPEIDAPASEPIAFPGVSVGCVEAAATDFYQSSGLWLRRRLCCLETGCLSGCPTGCCPDECFAEACDARRFRLDLIGGYRFHRHLDAVVVAENLVTTGTGAVPTGTMFSIVDSFRASNEFNGGELGLVGEFQRGRWSVELLAKMALGNNHQYLQINGTTAITPPGQARQNYTGGLLALPTNIGTYVRDDFVVIPQFGIELGYQLSCTARAFVGYNIVYWDNVAHAADQINLRIDSRNIPPALPGGGPDPTFTFNQGDFWAQSLTVGLELRY